VAIPWELSGFKRKPEQPGKNWMDIINRDLNNRDITWEEAETTGQRKSNMASKCGSMHPSRCGKIKNVDC